MDIKKLIADDNFLRTGYPGHGDDFGSVERGFWIMSFDVLTLSECKQVLRGEKRGFVSQMFYSKK